MGLENKNGANAFIETLELAGIDKIFTLSGNHIMPIYDAIFESNIDLIHTRHEAAAVHMADAWARLTGKVGIALVTGGPGHANAISALYTASMSESPVILFSGHAPIGQLGKGAFQEMLQADIAAPLTKASWVCQESKNIAQDVAKAIRIAKSGRPGPVHVSLPTDVLEALYPDTATKITPDSFAPEYSTINSSELEALIVQLKQAKKPLILAGPMMQSKDGRSTLKSLENHLSTPVVGMESPRGIGDPSLGAFSEILNQADCILLLGKKIDFTLKFAQSPGINQECVFLQIDPDQEEINRAKNAVGNRLSHVIKADIPTAIQAIIQLRNTGTANTDWQNEVQNAIQFRPVAWNALPKTSNNIHPAQALKPLQEILDSHPDSVLISDGGEIGQWAQACLNAPNRVINGVAGSIGSALPFAVAARVAKPDAPIVSVMGDGTFGFHSAEIDTAVRYKLPFVLVVGNDARWNAEYQIQVREYGKDRTIGCELLPSHYEKVCEAFGGYGELVQDSDNVLPAAKRAVATNLPSCLNIMIEGLAAPNIKRN